MYIVKEPSGHILGDFDTAKAAAQYAAQYFIRDLFAAKSPTVCYRATVLRSGLTPAARLEAGKVNGNIYVDVLMF